MYARLEHMRWIDWKKSFNDPVGLWRDTATRAAFGDEGGLA